MLSKTLHGSASGAIRKSYRVLFADEEISLASEQTVTTLKQIVSIVRLACSWAPRGMWSNSPWIRENAMSEERKAKIMQDGVSRRSVLGIGSAALAAAAFGELSAHAQTREGTRKAEGDHSSSNPGQENKPLLAENPHSNTPPPTDQGDVGPIWYSYDLTHKRIQEGGWTHQVTQRELPSSTEIAGVNMRLTAGSFRELHWHTADEWSIMLYGNARVTVLNPDGTILIDDVSKGDLWYFPAGFPHSIQGLGSLAEDRAAVGGQKVQSPIQYTFKMEAMAPTKRTTGGEIRIVDSHNFPVAKNIAAALDIIKPGGLRELHWHPNAPEWQFYMAGKGRMTVFMPVGSARTMDFNANDVGFVPFNAGHYVENTGDTDLVFLEMFKASEVLDFSLNQWIRRLPPEMVTSHLKLDNNAIHTIPAENLEILPR